MDIKANITPYGGANRALSTIKFLVVHYTANDGDTAWGNTNYFKNADRKAGAHFFVDEKEIYQSTPIGRTAYHCGTSGTYFSACRNANSIGVEMCSRINSAGTYYFMEETIDNTVSLVKYLMELYNIPITNVIRHYDVTHKVCPAPFVNDIAAWTKFKGRLEEPELTKDEIKALVQAELKAILAGGDTPSAWAADEWSKAINLGITDGSKPTGYVTREQCAAMTLRAKGE